MTTAAFETVLKRDRAVVAASLLVLTALSWGYVLWLWAMMNMASSSASMPSMPGMNMGPAPNPWGLGQMLFCFTMWSVMMVGMMLPSAAPMILLYARVGRQARADGILFAPTGWFAG